MKVQFFVLASLVTITSCKTPKQIPDNLTLYSLTGPDTRVVFNEPVDLRHAWLGNDAEVVNFESEILGLINSASTSIDVTTMTFTKMNIAEALAARAESGVDVRIVGAGFRRWQPGYWRAMAGGALVVDENLPALVHRVNFQSDNVQVGDYYVDQGNAYGVRSNGVSYGWIGDRTARMMNHGMFPSSLIDDSYVQSNSDTPSVWEIEVPNGFYYVHLTVGQANNSFHPDNYIRVEGQTVFFTTGPDYFEMFETNDDPAHTDLFKGCSVDLELSRRIQVSDGKLSVQVGKAGQSSFSSLAYIEIYRADQVFPNGDRCYSDGAEGGTDDEVQERTLQHTKYLIIDRDQANRTLWTSSGNLTESMDFLSEDAIISTNDGLCNTFRDQFNQQWGSNTILPNKANSNFGACKTLTPNLEHTIDGFDWKVRFSPSIGGVGGYDMGLVASEFIQNSANNTILVLEQFNSSSGFRGFTGPNQTWNTTIPNKLSTPNFELYAVGGENFDSNPWNGFSNANVAFVPRNPDPPVDIHNKYALSDAIDDSRFTRNGKVLCGSMNWSQSGMHSNDEQTLVINNPFIANQYLQHAAMRLRENNIEINRKADIVLVIDRSLSMNGLNHDGVTSKLEAAKDAAQLFLDLIETDEQHFVSLIRFGETVEPFAPAINLANYNLARRNALRNNIENIIADAPIGNSTCYGLPLAEAKAQLIGSGSGNPRKIIHFFTDGRENRAPFADTEYPDIADLGIEIHSSGFGNDALSSVLGDMAEASGGTYELVPLSTLDLKKRFAEVARDAMDFTTVLDPRYELFRGKEINQRVYLDEASKKVKFVFSWNAQKEKPIRVKITSPDGKVFESNEKGVEFTWSDSYLVVHVDTEKAGGTFKMEGEWGIDFASNGNVESSLLVDLIVLSNSDIRLQAEVIPFTLKEPSSVLILARLLDQGMPVINSQIRAELSEIDPKSGRRKTSTIQLYDDGNHNDGKQGDGLFGTSKKFRRSGNYSFLFISEGRTLKEGVTVRRDSRSNYSWGIPKDSKEK